MRFAFFRPNDLGEAVRIGTASRGGREKNAKVAVCGGPMLIVIIAHVIYSAMILA